MNEVDYSPKRYNGNGATKEFPFDWKAFVATDLIIKLVDSEGNVDTLSLGADYTVQIEAIGGNVVLKTPPVAGKTIVIERDVSDYQSTGYSTSTGFQGSEIEKSFDRVSCNLQEMNYNIETFKKDFSFEINNKIDENKKDTDKQIKDLADSVNLQITNNKKDTDKQIADFTNDINAEIRTFESEVNGKLDKVNSAADKINEMDKAVSDALDAADRAQNSAETAKNQAQEINQKIENILPDIITEGQKQVDNIKQTGFFMEDDKLYYINSEGEKKEFKSGNGVMNYGMSLYSPVDPKNEGLLQSQGQKNSAKVYKGIWNDYLTKKIEVQRYDFKDVQYNLDSQTIEFLEKNSYVKDNKSLRFEPEDEISFTCFLKKEPSQTNFATSLLKISKGETEIINIVALSNMDVPFRDETPLQILVFNRYPETLPIVLNVPIENIEDELQIKYSYYVKEKIPTLDPQIFRYEIEEKLSIFKDDNLIDSISEIRDVPFDNSFFDNSLFKSNLSFSYGEALNDEICRYFIDEDISVTSPDEFKNFMFDNTKLGPIFIDGFSGSETVTKEIVNEENAKDILDLSASEYDFKVDLTTNQFILPTLNGSETLPGDDYNEIYENSFIMPYNGYIVLKVKSESNNHCVLKIDDEIVWEFVVSTAYYHNETSRIFVRKNQLVELDGVFDIKKYSKAKGNSDLYFYVGDSVKNEGEIDVSKVLSQIAQVSAELEKKPSMLDASSASMPSGQYTEVPLGASGMIFKAPKNGWLIVAKTSGVANEYLQFNSTAEYLGYRNQMLVGDNAPAPGYLAYCYMPMLEGQSTQIFYNASGQTLASIFVYSKGVN